MLTEGIKVIHDILYFRCMLGCKTSFRVARLREGQKAAMEYQGNSLLEEEDGTTTEDSDPVSVTCPEDYETCLIYTSDAADE